MNPILDRINPLQHVRLDDGAVDGAVHDLQFANPDNRLANRGQRHIATDNNFGPGRSMRPCQRQ